MYPRASLNHRKVFFKKWKATDSPLTMKLRSSGTFSQRMYHRSGLSFLLRIIVIQLKWILRQLCRNRYISTTNQTNIWKDHKCWNIYRRDTYLTNLLYPFTHKNRVGKKATQRCQHYHIVSISFYHNWYETKSVS